MKKLTKKEQKEYNKLIKELDKIKTAQQDNYKNNHCCAVLVTKADIEFFRKQTIVTNRMHQIKFG